MSDQQGASREDRLRAALRDNLQRRKAQARGRARQNRGELMPDESAAVAKRREITALVTAELGYGEPDALEGEARELVEARVAALLDESTAIVPDLSDPMPANATLQRLLSEYRLLSNRRVFETEARLVGEGGGREDDA